MSLVGDVSRRPRLEVAPSASEQRHRARPQRQTSRRKLRPPVPPHAGAGVGRGNAPRLQPSRPSSRRLILRVSGGAGHPILCCPASLLRGGKSRRARLGGFWGATGIRGRGHRPTVKVFSTLSALMGFAPRLQDRPAACRSTSDCLSTMHNLYKRGWRSARRALERGKAEARAPLPFGWMLAQMLSRFTLYQRRGNNFDAFVGSLNANPSSSLATP